MFTVSPSGIINFDIGWRILSFFSATFIEKGLTAAEDEVEKAINWTSLICLKKSRGFMFSTKYTIIK